VCVCAYERNSDSTRKGGKGEEVQWKKKRRGEGRHKSPACLQIRLDTPLSFFFPFLFRCPIVFLAMAGRSLVVLSLLRNRNGTVRVACFSL